METRAVWKNEFNVGIEDMDAQHRYFLELVRRIEMLVDNDDAEGKEEKLLGELARYTRYHFTCEELLMELYGYPGIEKHRKEHRRLFARLDEFLEKKGTEAFSISRVMAFLYAWFAGHTTLDDREFAAHIKKKRRLAFDAEADGGNDGAVTV